jgi:nicotinate-nucleotide adenylyltransferase
MKEITNEKLAELRERVRENMSDKRFLHTLAVEDMTARLCALFCPAHTQKMRAAALLHDVTKELSAKEQIALCEQLGLSVTEFERIAPKTLHARTAAALIGEKFSDFDDPMIVNAVRWHTTGHADMTLTEQILYLADYIDDSRTFEFCVKLRRMFWDADPAGMSEKERLFHFYRVLMRSFDTTIADLVEGGKSIAPDTVNARNSLLLRLMQIEV